MNLKNITITLSLLMPGALNAGLNVSKMCGSKGNCRVEVTASVAFHEQETYAPDGKRTRDVIYLVKKEAKALIGIVNENSQWIERKSVPVTTTPSLYSVALILKTPNPTIDAATTATLACVTTRNYQSKDIQERIITIPLDSDFKDTYELDLKDDLNENLTLTVSSHLYQ